MRFITDENMGPTVSKWLVTKGHEIFSVYDESPGLTDEEILEKAFQENYIVITGDKDFGELVYKHQLPHKGVVLLRLTDETPPSKIKVLEQLLSQYAEQLPNKFTVVTEIGVRII